jgi:hypothetical protein
LSLFFLAGATQMWYGLLNVRRLVGRLSLWSAISISASKLSDNVTTRLHHFHRTETAIVAFLFLTLLHGRGINRQEIQLLPLERPDGVAHSGDDIKEMK